MMKSCYRTSDIVTIFRALILAPVFLGFGCFSHIAYAADASLFISPITATYTTGQNATLTVVVASGGESINAVEGKLEFDPKEVEMLSVDTSDSVLSSWTIPPEFSTSTGELSFAGLLSTSTVVERGKILKFSMKTLRSGEVHIRFDSGAAIHAADGTGGNILTSLHEGVYNVIPEGGSGNAPIPEGVSPDVLPNTALNGGEVLGASTGTPFTSDTYPDQDTWYSTTTGKFTWGVSPGVMRVQLSLNKKPSGDGTVMYDTLLTEKMISGIDQGISYAHYTEVYSDGNTKTTIYRIKVDTSPPVAVTISEKPRSDSADPNVVVITSATDTLSGVDHYEFVVDQKNSLMWNDDGSHEYHLPPQNPGQHELVMNVFDKAHNSSSARLQFTVGYLPTPTISHISEKVTEGDKLIFAIDSLPNTHQSVSIARADDPPSVEEFVVDGTGHGEFKGVSSVLPGVYHVWVVAHDDRGAKSQETEHKEIVVGTSFLGVVKRHPMVPIALIGLLILSFISWVFWQRLHEDEDDTELDENDEESHAASPPPQRRVSSGAVVLGKREPVRMPATRL